MDMQGYRNEINSIDEQLVALFTRRMRVAKEIAKYKAENHLPVFDPERERQIKNK